MEHRIPKDVYNEAVYTIGHAARLVGAAVSTLRMYEQEGLIIPYRTPTQRRLYSRRDIEYIGTIQRLLHKEKLNIQGIKRLISLIPCWRITDCPQDVYSSCNAYEDHASDPCWMNTGNCQRAKEIQCSECEVYLNTIKMLENPKSLIKECGVIK